MTNTDIISSLLSRQDTWRGRNRRLPRQTICTGHQDLNSLLQGGWPAAAITELIPQQLGIGELSLLLPVLKNHSRKNQLCLWLDPPYQPYAPALSAEGIALDKLIIVRSKNTREWLWTAEQSIRNGALLLAWIGQQPARYAELRKLQLAAAESNNSAFLFSPIAALTAPSPAVLRLELDSTHIHQLQITLRKLRGRVAGAKLQLDLQQYPSQRTVLNQLPTDRHRTYSASTILTSANSPLRS